VLLFFLVKSEHNVTGKTILRLFIATTRASRFRVKKKKETYTLSGGGVEELNQFCLACNSSVGVKR
jgi:hypothetical protein